MKNLRVIMADRDVTGSQLSEDLGISKTTVSSYVNGRVQRIDIKIMHEIADYFDVSLDELFGRTAYTAGNHLGERIKQIRLEKGMTLEEFGNNFYPPANRSSVSSWENGRYVPGPSRVKKIAELANISVNELLKGE